MKLCVFANDPLQAYFEKGEIKKRYFNPENFFDEIHFISFIEKDIEIAKIQKIGGTARVIIHSVGKISIRKRKKSLNLILELVKKIKPDIIRSYNPLLEGWFAANCAKKLNLPFFISLHTQYDHNRKIAKKNNLKKFLALKYTEKFIEPFVLKNADKITAVYKIIVPYVEKHSTTNVEILHNKVDCNRFQTATKIDNILQPMILSVGNLIPVKNHSALIKAIKNIDANLMIIGNGEQYQELMDLIKNLNLENKVTIKKSVPNDQIQNYYKSAKIFALAYNPELEALPIPVIEAMATGLPVIIPHPKESFSEGLEGIAIFSKNDEKSFEKNIKTILNNKNLQEEISKKSLQKSKEFDESKIEAREAQIYAELIKKRKNNEEID